MSDLTNTNKLTIPHEEICRQAYEGVRSAALYALHRLRVQHGYPMDDAKSIVKWAVAEVHTEAQEGTL